MANTRNLISQMSIDLEAELEQQDTFDLLVDAVTGKVAIGILIKRLGKDFGAIMEMVKTEQKKVEPAAGGGAVSGQHKRHRKRYVCLACKQEFQAIDPDMCPHCQAHNNFALKKDYDK